MSDHQSINTIPFCCSALQQKERGTADSQNEGAAGSRFSFRKRKCSLTLGRWEGKMIKKNVKEIEGD